MYYRLIAIDLDGTLLDQTGQVSPENFRAIAEAQAAGALVVPCTGRAWCESAGPLASMSNPGIGVFVTGATVTDVRTGRSVDLSFIDAQLVADIVEHLFDMPEAILILREPFAAGYDYLVTGRGELTENTKWWFETYGTKVHYSQNPRIEDLAHTLRIGAVGSQARIREIVSVLQHRFSDELFVQYFGSVQIPDQPKRAYVLEVFARGVNKWRGVQWVADQHEIPADQIVVIGDEINDITMLENAGCAIAMDNGIETVKHIADHVTLHHEEHGVAHAIGQLIAGKW